MIAVDGKLQNRILQSPNGDRRVLVEIHADDVRFLEGAKPRADAVEEEHEAMERAEKPVEVAARPAPVEESVVPESPDAVGSNDYDDADAPWFSDETDGTPLEFKP